MSKFLTDQFNLVVILGGGGGGGFVYHKYQKLPFCVTKIFIFDCESFTEYLDCSALEHFEVSDVFLYKEFVTVIWHPVLHLTNHYCNTKGKKHCNIWYVHLSIKYTSVCECEW